MSEDNIPKYSEFMKYINEFENGNYGLINERIMELNDFTTSKRIITEEFSFVYGVYPNESKYYNKFKHLHLFALVNDIICRVHIIGDTEEEKENLDTIKDNLEEMYNLMRVSIKHYGYNTYYNVR